MKRTPGPSSRGAPAPEAPGPKAKAAKALPARTQVEVTRPPQEPAARRAATNWGHFAPSLLRGKCPRGRSPQGETIDGNGSGAETRQRIRNNLRAEARD